MIGKNLTTLIYIAVAAIAFLALQIPLSGYIVDDAFIHLTFARNVAQGHGFAFNPDVPTYGSTAPLWTLLLALLSLIFSPGFGMTKTLAIVFGALTIPAFRLLAGNVGLTNKSANVATLIWAVNVWLVRWTASGMEATLATLLLLLAINAQLKYRNSAAVWLGFAMLCRPEVAIIAVIFGLDRWKTEGIKQALQLVGIVLLVVLPWQIYALFTFGTVVPNTALVKGGFGLPNFSDFIFGLRRTVLIICSAYCLEILLILVGLTILLFRKLILSDSIIRTIALLSIWAIFPAAVYLSQGVFITSRYLLIGLPALTILMFLILDELEYRRRLTLWRYGRYIITSVIIVLQLFLTLRVTLPHVAAFKPTIEVLTRIAERLKTETPSGASVAVGDVGVIGFYSDRYVIDLEGLVTHEMIPYRVGIPLDDLIISGRYLKVKQTDYFIDKSQTPGRLTDISPDLYKVIMVEPVPGGLVGTADEQWYYTLYKLNK
ncbi:MAG: hypothetical protein P9X24_07915 [Candidatus Hatepunaea meridiana]|nr:hypothetical protein [Candidatus Hatepunaea meridiana]